LEKKQVKFTHPQKKTAASNGQRTGREPKKKNAAQCKYEQEGYDESKDKQINKKTSTSQT